MSSHRWRGLKRQQAADAKILAETEVRAQEILHEAARNAKEIIARANKIQVITAQELAADLRTDHAHVKNQITQVLTSLNDQLETMAATTITELQKKTEDLLQDAAQKNKQLASKLQDQLTKHAIQERRGLDASLQELRHKKIQSITTLLQQEIPHIVKKVVGKSLSLNDHEALVQEALEQAANDISWT